MDPLYKNILWRQNPYKLVFQDISTFGYPNPTIGILLSKIESLKISEEKINDLLKKTPDPKTIKTENGWKNLKQFNRKVLGQKVDSHNDNDE